MSACGINKFCYGEFRCPRCNRFWSSNQTWRDGGQECKRCRVSVKPHNLEQLRSFVCPTSGCGFKWTSKKDEASCCRKCTSTGLMFDTPSERQIHLKNYLEIRDDWDDDDERIGHLSELCERCQQSPLEDCRLKSMPDNEVWTTRSTTSLVERDRVARIRSRADNQPQKSRSHSRRRKRRANSRQVSADESDEEQSCCAIS